MKFEDFYSRECGDLKISPVWNWGDEIVSVGVYFNSDEERNKIQLLAGLYCGQAKEAFFGFKVPPERSLKIEFPNNHLLSAFLEALYTFA